MDTVLPTVTVFDVVLNVNPGEPAKLDETLYCTCVSPPPAAAPANGLINVSDVVPKVIGSAVVNLKVLPALVEPSAIIVVMPLVTEVERSESLARTHVPSDPVPTTET